MDETEYLNQGKNGKRLRESIKQTKVMNIQKFVILKKYLEWVEQVSEDIPDKSHFEPTEIVFKICDIIEAELTKKQK